MVGRPGPRHRRGGPVRQEDAQADRGLDDRTGDAQGGITVFAERGPSSLSGGPRIRVRTFPPGEGVAEDPVCGSGNGSIAAFLARHKHAHEPEGAYVAEQGVTTPGVPTEESIGGQPIPAGVDPVPEPEITQQAVDRTNDFVRFLAAPPPEREDAETRQGRDVFGRVGCQRCHVPELVTGPSPTAALSEKRFAAYTDLLLHDMGPDLADICLGLALPSEFRTEPLIGLRSASKFLHDGRTTSLEQAIELHGGEATAARDRFRALSPSERAALLAFLKTL